MKHSEHAALGQYLSDFPVDMTYEDVLEAIESGHDDVIVYSPFSDMDGNEVADLIDTAQRLFEKLIEDTGGADSEMSAAPSPGLGNAVVTVNLSGGIVEDVSANIPVSVIVLDADCDGFEDDELVVIEGKRYLATEHGVGREDVDESTPSLLDIVAGKRNINQNPFLKP